MDTGREKFSGANPAENDHDLGQSSGEPLSAHFQVTIQRSDTTVSPKDSGVIFHHSASFVPNASVFANGPPGTRALSRASFSARREKESKKKSPQLTAQLHVKAHESPSPSAVAQLTLSSGSSHAESSASESASSEDIDKAVSVLKPAHVSESASSGDIDKAVSVLGPVHVLDPGLAIDTQSPISPRITYPATVPRVGMEPINRHLRSLSNPVDDRLESMMANAGKKRLFITVGADSPSHASHSGSEICTPRGDNPLISPRVRSGSQSGSQPSTPRRTTYSLAGTVEKKITPPDKLLATVVEGELSDGSKEWDEDALTPSEQEYKTKYFAHLVEAIKEFNYNWFRIMLGPVKYQVWVDYVRKQHRLELPTQADFYQKTLDFMASYRKKYHLEQLYSSHLDLGGFTPCAPTVGAYGEGFKKALKRRREEIPLVDYKQEHKSPVSSGVAEIRRSINEAHAEAVKEYEKRGVVGYLDIMSLVEADLETYAGGGSLSHLVTVPEKKPIILDATGLNDFHKKLEMYVEEVITQEFLSQLELKLANHVEILSEIPTRQLGDAMLNDLYKKPWRTQYEKHLRKACQRFMRSYVENGYGKINHLDKLSETLSKNLKACPPQPLDEKGLNDNYRMARDVYRNSIERGDIEAAVIRAKHGSPAFAFAGQMVELFDSMRYDAFSRMSDEDGNPIFHYLMAAYREASETDREKLKPFVSLALKHGCNPYVFNKRKKGAFEAECVVTDAEKKKEKNPGAFPDWFILKEMNNCFMPTFNPAEETVRTVLLDYASEAEKDEDKWYGLYKWLFYNSKIRNMRREDLLELTKQLYIAQKSFSDMNLIGKTALLDKNKQTGGRGNSRLYDESHLGGFLTKVGREPGTGDLLVFSQSALDSLEKYRSWLQEDLRRSGSRRFSLVDSKDSGVKNEGDGKQNGISQESKQLSTTLMMSAMPSVEANGALAPTTQQVATVAQPSDRASDWFANLWKKPPLAPSSTVNMASLTSKSSGPPL